MEKVLGLMTSMAEAAERFVADGQQVSPAFLIADAVDHRSIFLAPWGDDEERRQILNAVRTKMRELGAVRYVVVSESWISMASSTADIKKIRPSKDPNRIEVVMVTGIETIPERVALMHVYRIDRENNRLVLDPKLSSAFEPGSVQGELTRMLDDPLKPIDTAVSVISLADKLETKH